ncbi:MAG TPA: DUF4238 domain-containing protein, partial [Flavobacteriales bacterium]|nr:DUF4238 domain-containing protein [Flavobacteriales bacterium]
MAKEIKHHVVPSAYLRHFQIDDQANKNFVWCIDCSSKYNLRPQRVGVKHRIFTSPNYYADPRYANPQVFEQLLGRDFEPKYPEIMSDVNAAKITESTVAKLMHWLFISKMRSPMTRSSSEQLLGWMINTANKMKRLEITPEEQSRIDLRVAL